MDFSDSDSDGSHISATPPRDPPKPKSRPSPSPSPSPKPPLPTSRPILLSSHKSTLRVRASSSVSHSSKPNKPSSKYLSTPDLNPTRPEQPQAESFPVIPSNLPFRIRRQLSDHQRVVSGVDSLENLPAGFFSRAASFSKFRGSSLNFERIGENPCTSSASASLGKFDIGGADCLEDDWLPEELKNEIAVGYGNSGKVARRHSNLIGSNVPEPPVKKPKCGSEGNFVKLNLKGRKRKFLNKRGNSSSSRGRRYYRRFKNILKAEPGTGADGAIQEEDLATELTNKLNQRQESKNVNFESNLIEEAILVVRKEPTDDNLVKLLRLTHGYDSFRDGQLETIKMVLEGKSTMLVLPTGAGKSLCYQLAALILPGITLVVSPLVALMIDQLKQLPPIIQGGLLSSFQTPNEVLETKRLLIEGIIKVLFVSPERFLNAEFSSLFSGNLVISLVVVDEAHCISEWSHNFRPSYMRLRASLLKSELNVNHFLAMTATATTKTLNATMSALEIPLTNLIQKSQLRDNLRLSVSLSGNRMKDLLVLIKSHPYSELKSIIIYTKFQAMNEDLKKKLPSDGMDIYPNIQCLMSSLLHSDLQVEVNLISRYLCDNNIIAKGYHSNMPGKDRSRVQELFCSNKIRVVVATVAFGMGLDKSDVGAVIHYSLPESLEEYVQEIGRAGRDESLSYCHLFLDDDTYFKLRSLMFSEGVDKYAVNKILSQLFPAENNLKGKICSLVKESASRKFDMKEEVILTILTHLELGEAKYLHMLPQINVTCSLSFHKTSPTLLAEKDIVAAAILDKSEMNQGQYVFDMPTVANDLGVSTTDLLNQMQNLKLKGEVAYELKDQAYCYMIVETPQDLCSLSAHLTEWLSEVESCKVRKLDFMFNAAVFAVNACKKIHGCSGVQHTPCLQKKILSYFAEDDNCDVPNKMSQSSPFLRADIKVFLQSNSHVKFTPRAVARILHGIASPAYPSMVWSKTHFWGRYKQTDFQVVMEAAKAELISFVGQDAVYLS